MCSDCKARTRETMALKAMALREEERRAKKKALAEAFRKRNDERLAKQEGRALSDNNDDSGKESKEESVVETPVLQFQTMALDAPLSYQEVNEMLKELPLLNILRESWWTFFRGHVFPGSNAYAVRFPRAGDVLVVCSEHGEFLSLDKVTKVEFGNVYLPNGVTLVPAEKGGFLKFGGANETSWRRMPLTRAYAEKLLKGTTECPRTSSKGKGRASPCLCYLVGRDEHSDAPWVGQRPLTPEGRVLQQETPKKECTVEDIEAAIWKKWPRKILLESIERDMRRVFQAEYSVRPRSNQSWHREILIIESPEHLVKELQRLNIRPKYYDLSMLDYGRVDFRYTLGDPKFPPYSPVNQPVPQRVPQ